jgi:dihydroorotate dehydrogenase electron transfer subunit
VSAGGLPSPARLGRVRRENDRTVTIELDAATRAAPGQFAMLWLPGLDEKPFALLSGAPLAFTVAAVGPFSRAVHALAPGDRIWWRGPFGHGFSTPSRPGPTILVGGGYGVAPLVFAARRLGAGAGTLTAVVGARTATEVLLVADLRAAGAEVVITTEDGSAGERGLATGALRRLLAATPGARVMACGPHGMLAAVESVAAEAGAPAELSWEAYMRCALGICGSCEHGGLLLCADGPVLACGPG